MARLPETEEDEKVLGDETVLGDKRKFFSGFFAGILVVILCLILFGAGRLGLEGGLLKRLLQSGDGQQAEVLTDRETLHKLGEIQRLVEQCYYNDVDSDTLSAYLFKGAIAGLEDVYGGYYTAEELQSLMDSTRGAYYGVGAVLAEDTTTKEIRVLEVYDGSPADKAGLEPGDVLLFLDDTSLIGSGLQEAVALIRSRDGPFTLTVYRQDTEEERQITMECDNVELTYVEAEMKEGQIGYIRLSEFTESAVEQFEDALELLKSRGAEKLVIDLRNNPGGLLDSVCTILDKLLPEGLIVYTEDRNGQREEFYSDEEQSFSGTVAVLVNGNSASASEIFAGAVQDYGLGPVIGTGTYGKGVVQQTFSLSDGSAVKLTTKKYFTPLGQDIDGNGITPDMIVEEEDAESSEDRALDRAVEELGSVKQLPRD